MAIDTIEKKLSLMDFDEMSATAVPYPDGSLDQGDLQHGLWSYSGIAYATVTTPSGESISAYAQLAWQHPPHQSPAPSHNSAWNFSRLLEPLFPRFVPGV